MNIKEGSIEFFVLLILGMIALWLVISFMGSFFGGWWLLTNGYRCQKKLTGTTWLFQSGSMGRGIAASMGINAEYGMFLIVTANDDGLGMSGIPYLLPFHPQLFIPWEEISVRQMRAFFIIPQVVLTFAAHPDVRFSISNRLADKIQAATGQNWFDEVPQPAEEK